MWSILYLISISICPSTGFPFPLESNLEQSIGLGLYPRCGPVSQFYNPTKSDWTANDLDSWLNNWWNNHTSDISANSGGFTGAYGQWALGNPGWTCLDNGSNDDCDLNPCDARVLNDKGDEIRQAYYVLVAINKLPTYFIGLGESFEVSAIGAALKR